MDHVLFLRYVPCMLALLLPVPYLCGATEFYVRSTEPMNTSCSGQPCLTFSQYVRDSDHYFKSHTVFRFQSGTHQVNASVIIRYVHNISMMAIERSKETKVIVYLAFNQPSASSTPECRGFVFWNTTYVTIDGLTIVVHSQNKVPLFGMTFMNITHLCIKHSTMITGNKLWSYSINVIGGGHINMTSLTVTHGGIKLIDTEYVTITKMTAVFCHCGICMLSTNNTAVTDVEVRSAYYGMYLNFTIHTRIRSTTLEDISIYAKNITITDISHTDIRFWKHAALQIHKSTYLNITTVSTLFSDYGILVYNAHYITLKNISLQNPGRRGIYFTESKFIDIRNTHILGQEVFTRNGKRYMFDTMGVIIFRTTNLHLFNLEVIHCSFGIFLYKSNAVTVNNMTPYNWTGHSIYMLQVTNTTMQNIVM